MWERRPRRECFSMASVAIRGAGAAPTGQLCALGVHSGVDDGNPTLPTYGAGTADRRRAC